MKKNKISKYFIFATALTLFSVFVLVIQSSYNKLIGPLQKVEADSTLNPINLKVDNQVLIDIKERQEFLPNQIAQLFAPPTPTPTIISSPEASSEASLIE